MYVGIVLSDSHGKRKVFCTRYYWWDHFPAIFVAEFYLQSDWLAAD